MFSLNFTEFVADYLLTLIEESVKNKINSAHLEQREYTGNLLNHFSSVTFDSYFSTQTNTPHTHPQAQGHLQIKLIYTIGWE